MKKWARFFLYFLGLPKTIYFNFKYLPVKQAIKLPILISHRVVLKVAKGKIQILPEERVKSALIKIGFGYVGIFDNSRSRSIWECSGTVIFYGVSNIGHGNKICVGENGILEIGDCFNITAESQIVCCKSIVFQNNVLISWQCLIMDTDFHQIYKCGVRRNSDKEIIIGNNVWIGCRSTILKGVKVADGVVIAANSNVVRSIDERNCIVGGNPAKALVGDIEWEK